MVKDGEDSHGLQTTNSRFRLNFLNCANGDVSPLMLLVLRIWQHVETTRGNG